MRGYGNRGAARSWRRAPCRSPFAGRWSVATAAAGESAPPDASDAQASSPSHCGQQTAPGVRMTARPSSRRPIHVCSTLLAGNSFSVRAQGRGARFNRGHDPVSQTAWGVRLHRLRHLLPVASGCNSSVGCHRPIHISIGRGVADVSLGTQSPCVADSVRFAAWNGRCCEERTSVARAATGDRRPKAAMARCNRDFANRPAFPHAERTIAGLKFQARDCRALASIPQPRRSLRHEQHLSA